MKTRSRHWAQEKHNQGKRILNIPTLVSHLKLRFYKNLISLEVSRHCLYLKCLKYHICYRMSAAIQRAFCQGRKYEVPELFSQGIFPIRGGRHNQNMMVLLYKNNLSVRKAAVLSH